MAEEMDLFKSIKVPGIRGEVKVNRSGTVLMYNGKELHKSLVKAKKASHGYYQVAFAGKAFYVHKLVAMAFVHNPKPLSYKLVLYKDSNTLNNTADNLMWGNQKMAVNNKKRKVTDSPVYRGSSKISYEEALKIAGRLDSGEHANKICNEYGVSEMSIARIRKRYCIKKDASPRYSRTIKDTALKLMGKYTTKMVAEITGIRYETLLGWKKKSAEY